MTSAPIVLVPGFWLGGWARDDAAALRADGHNVTAVTLPGLESADADFSGVEKPLPTPKDLADNENLTGLTERQLETFRRRAIPEPGAALRGAAELTNDARLDVPSTVVCTGYTSEQYKDAAKEGQAWLGGLTELRSVTYVDLPTSHWPMWSRPRELAAILGDIA